MNPTRNQPKRVREAPDRSSASGIRWRSAPPSKAPTARLMSASSSRSTRARFKRIKLSPASGIALTRATLASVSNQVRMSGSLGPHE